MKKIKEEFEILFLNIRKQFDNPSYLAKSNMVGMAMAFAPFPGQTPVIVALWFIGKKIRFRFNLAIAIGWSFISNVFTNVPLFYLYYRTGNFLLQKESSLKYETLTTDVALSLGQSFFIGSGFYMLVFGFIGYFSGLFIAKIGNKKR